MLRNSLRAARSLSRRALSKPPSLARPLSSRPRLVASTVAPQPRDAARRCLSPWRAIHTTRQRLSAQNSPNSEPPQWKGLAQWDIITYEPLDSKDRENILTVLVVVMGLITAYNEIPKHLPIRSNPKHLLKESLEIIKESEAVASRLGTPLVGQGERVYGSHHIESVKIKAQDGKPSRLRIKYYLTGPKGRASVFAEVTDGTAKGEYNYLVVQFDGAEAVTLIDHRDASDAAQHKADIDAPSKTNNTKTAIGVEALKWHKRGE